MSELPSFMHHGSDGHESDMQRTVEYQTEHPDIRLRELTQKDAEAFFNAVDASREHLSQFGDNTAARFPDIESVYALLAASEDNGTYWNRHLDALRLGIWLDETFVGSISLRQMGERYEVGYWLDERHTGQGYATIALRALAARTPRYTDTFAAIHARNHASISVVRRAGFVLDSSDGDIEYYAYQKQPSSVQPEPVVYAQTLSKDIHTSVARIGLRGRNAAVINHGSSTNYEVVLGNGVMNIDGTDHYLFEGARISVPAGTPYQDSGHVVMLATSQPPFDGSTIELLERNLID